MVLAGNIGNPIPDKAIIMRVAWLLVRLLGLLVALLASTSSITSSVTSGISCEFAPITGLRMFIFTARPQELRKRPEPFSSIT